MLNAQALGKIPLALNLVGLATRRENGYTEAEELIRVLNPTGKDGICCLEISEQQLLGDPSVLVPHVRAIQQAGIKMAIDDVGFGNSCLEGLIMLHPQVMKVDKRLVRGLAADPEMRRALERMLRVADVLGAEVVAEGIKALEAVAEGADFDLEFTEKYIVFMNSLIPKVKIMI